MIETDKKADDHNDEPVKGRLVREDRAKLNQQII
jgi:hypothetical protein